MQPPHCSCSVIADRTSFQLTTFALTPLAEPHNMQSLCLFSHLSSLPCRNVLLLLTQSASHRYPALVVIASRPGSPGVILRTTPRTMRILHLRTAQTSRPCVPRPRAFSLSQMHWSGALYSLCTVLSDLKTHICGCVCTSGLLCAQVSSNQAACILEPHLCFMGMPLM